MKKPWIALSIIPLLWLGVVIMNLFASPTRPLGVTDGRLAACPNSPNCVSTQAEEKSQAMEPIPCSGNWAQVATRVRRALEGLSGMQVIQEGDHYLHATATTRWLRFVDDVEFYYDEEDGLLHFRSASRIGYSDMGTNRRRMQKFQSLFNKLP